MRIHSVYEYVDVLGDRAPRAQVFPSDYYSVFIDGVIAQTAFGRRAHAKTLCKYLCKAPNRLSELCMFRARRVWDQRHDTDSAQIKYIYV